MRFQPIIFVLCLSLPAAVWAQEQVHCPAEASPTDTYSQLQDLRNMMDENTEGKIEAAEIDYDLQNARASIAQLIDKMSDLQMNLGHQGAEGEIRLETLGSLEMKAEARQKAMEKTLKQTWEPEDQRTQALAALKDIQALYKKAVVVAGE